MHLCDHQNTIVKMSETKKNTIAVFLHCFSTPLHLICISIRCKIAIFNYIDLLFGIAEATKITISKNNAIFIFY